MARKNLVKKFLMYDGTSGNMGATITSEYTIVTPHDKASILVSWANGSTPVGTMTVEATNDDPLTSSAVWVEIDMGATISISGNSGDHNLIFNELPFRAIRLVYTRSSGDGDLTAKFGAKSVGA